MCRCHIPRRRRLHVGARCIALLDLPVPCLVEGLGDATGAWPNLSGLSFMKSSTSRAKARPTMPGAYIAYLHTVTHGIVAACMLPDFGFYEVWNPGVSD